MLRRAPLTPISGNRTPRKEHDLLTKGQILGQAKAGLTSSQISRNLKLPRTSVRDILGRLNTDSAGVNKPRSGRLSILSPRDNRALIRYVRHDPKVTWRQIKTDTGLDFDTGTLRRTLKINEISHWLALKRPKLTSEIALLRLNWAENHKNWTVEEWRKII